MAWTTRIVSLRLATTLLLACISSNVLAQTSVVTYTLEDVWFEPDDAWDDPRQMTGTFEWTYEVGDFENGTGVFTELYIPWFWSTISDVITTVETTSLEFTFDGNWHGYGLDVSLFLNEPLSSDSPATIDASRSRYQVEVGVIHQGIISGGSIVPAGPVCQVDLNDDGVLNFFDVSAFLNAFTAQDILADFNSDGLLNFFDVSTFLNAFTAGCP